MGKHRQRKPKDWKAKKRENPSWGEIVKENELMINYYKAQGIIPSEEWDTFWTYCRKDLPSTFRISTMRGQAQDLLRSLRDGYISKISQLDLKKASEKEKPTTNGDNNSTEKNKHIEEEEEESEQDLSLEPIKWYPNNLAWTSNLSRRFLRRSEILQKLHRFLVEDSECGAISRQEAVSMIPPMLLDVKPHHMVLDMCAAPGSKTGQIIEMMHDDVGNDGKTLPTGAVVANDADHKRCYLLTHQAKRLETHCVMITNHDASVFPKLYAKNRDENHGDGGSGEGTLLEFDRVLCDVPCSGDGTIRKNPQLWSKWTPHLGTSLHGLQIRILNRGLELLKVGGRLVYSTCSFNPIENEAVIAAVLSRAQGSVELFDCSAELPELVRRPGVTSWKVCSRTGKEYKTMADVVGERGSEGYKETMFPLPEGELKALNIERCVRIFPNDQNTGGFFIAVFEKKRELPWQKAKRSRNNRLMPWELLNQEEAATKTGKEEESASVVDNGDVTVGVAVAKDNNHQDGERKSEEKPDDEKKDNNVPSSPPRKKFRRGQIREAPYIFLDKADQELQDIRNFYGFSADLPTNQFLVRGHEGKKRHIYLVSTGVEKIISSNPNLKIINTGLRVLSRSQFTAGKAEHGLSYRLVQDGLHLMSRFVSNRCVNITYDDLVTFLTHGELETAQLGPSTLQQLEGLTMGCVLWHFNPSGGVDYPQCSVQADIWLCGHYGHKLVQCMITREEKKHFLRLLGVPIPDELQVKVKGSGWGDAQEGKDEVKKKEEEGEEEDEKIEVESAD